MVASVFYWTKLSPTDALEAKGSLLARHTRATDHLVGNVLAATQVQKGYSDMANSAHVGDASSSWLSTAMNLEKEKTSKRFEFVKFWGHIKVERHCKPASECSGSCGVAYGIVIEYCHYLTTRSTH